MKISEFKLKIQSELGSLIDTYFGSNSISDKFINATLKILLKQNIHKYDNILEIFADENGEINELDIIEEYSKVFPCEGFVFDVRDYIKNDLIKSLMPNKALVIKKDDLINLLKN